MVLTFLPSCAAHLLAGNSHAGAASFLLQAVVVVFRRSCGCSHVIMRVKPHQGKKAWGRLQSSTLWLSGFRSLGDDGERATGTALQHLFAAPLIY